MNNDELRAFGVSIKEIITTLRNRINASEMKEIDSSYNAGEYTLAIESLLFNVVHDKIPLTVSEREQLLHFGCETGAETDYLSPFLAMGLLGSPRSERIMALNRAGEYKLAIETLCHDISNDNIQLTAGERDALIKLGQDMGVEAELLKPFTAND